MGQDIFAEVIETDVLAPRLLIPHLKGPLYVRYQIVGRDGKVGYRIGGNSRRAAILLHGRILSLLHAIPCAHPIIFMYLQVCLHILFAIRVIERQVLYQELSCLILQRIALTMVQHLLK